MQAATHVIDQNWGRHALGPRMHQHGRRRQNQAANQLVADASDALVEESLTDAPCWVNLEEGNHTQTEPHTGSPAGAFRAGVHFD